MVASEAAPYAKTGGLADVIGALPAALQSQGDQVAVVMPLYREALPKLEKSERVFENMPVRLGPAEHRVNIRKLENHGVQFYFVQEDTLYSRNGLYGEAGSDYPDNDIRFGVLCRAALELIRSLFRPDVLHLHDWQAALTAVLVRRMVMGDPTFYGIKTLLTIHNLGFQGLFDRTSLARLGLPKDLFHPDRMEFYGRVNFLKGGIVDSDSLNTVSKRYAEEIQTPEYGFGLDGLLRSRSGEVTGIVNGVDYEVWNPATDRYIAARYSVDDLTGKAVCKQNLLKTFGLPATNLNLPLIGIVSRFAGQKGFDLIEEIAPTLAKANVSIVALGTGEPRYEKMFQDLATAFPGKIAVRVGYSNELAHKIEAGADIFLMPSRYEPCGLNQIYSLRYGTVPVVRATGGLDDTIDQQTGFKFQKYDGLEFLKAIETAILAYRNRARWSAMMMSGMKKDFSWHASALEYRALYRQLAVPSTR